MKVIIVGGVAGGAGAAARLRRNDERAEIILLERGPYISFANCGLPYFLGGVIEDEAALLLYTPETFTARSKVDVRVRQEAVSVDPKARLIRIRDHERGLEYEESYDKLILSPGARAVRPPLEGREQDHVFVLRSLEDCLTMDQFLRERRPRSAAVVGAGFIGVEMAENFRQRGLEVTLVEAAPTVLGLDADMAAEVQNHMRSHQVNVLLECRAKAVTSNSLVLEDGREVAADLVLLSAGVAPDTAFLKGSGIELGPRGEILVDETMKTSADHVYAVGDAVAVTHIVTGLRQTVALASPAARQARIAADAVAGRPARYGGAQGTAIAKVFDMTVATTGLSESALKKTDLPWTKSLTVSMSHAGYYPGASPLTVKLLFHPQSGRLYGAQVTGREGVDKRLDVLATALRGQKTVFDLQELELAYAPPYSSSKDPVNIAGYVAGNIIEQRSKVVYAEDLDEAGDTTLLDIRSPEEYDAGAVAGSRNIPLPVLRQKLDSLEKDKPVCVICQIGLRGHIGSEVLRHAGFRVRNLMGGYHLYAQITADRKARQRHQG